MDDNMVLSMFFWEVFFYLYGLESQNKLSPCLHIKVSKAYSSHTTTATLLDVFFQSVACYDGVMAWETKRDHKSVIFTFLLIETSPFLSLFCFHPLLCLCGWKP